MSRKQIMRCSDRCCGACPWCIGEAAYDDGEEELQDFDVIIYRMLSQKVRVKAKDEVDAVQVAREQLDNKADGWDIDDKCCDWHVEVADD